MMMMEAPALVVQEHSHDSSQHYLIRSLKATIRKELMETCNEKPFLSELHRMTTPSTIQSGLFSNAGSEIMRSGLEQMREHNEKLYMRVIHLEASNKRLKDQLKLLVEVDSQVAQRAKEALEMEPS